MRLAAAFECAPGQLAANGHLGGQGHDARHLPSLQREQLRVARLANLLRGEAVASHGAKRYHECGALALAGGRA